MNAHDVDGVVALLYQEAITLVMDQYGEHIDDREMIEELVGELAMPEMITLFYKGDELVGGMSKLDRATWIVAGADADGALQFPSLMPHHVRLSLHIAKEWESTRFVVWQKQFDGVWRKFNSGSTR